jgi:hypothetical protein
MTAISIKSTTAVLSRPLAPPGGRGNHPEQADYRPRKYAQNEQSLLPWMLG